MSQTPTETTDGTEKRLPPDPNLTGEDLIRASEELVPILRERRVEADVNRGISKDTYRLLEDAGLIHMLLPKKYGGLELDDHTVAMTTLNLARGCAATAWVTTIMSVGNILILAFPEEVHEEAWADNSYATLAGNVNYNPNATAVRVDGGYRVSGSWYFGSGSDHADWLILNGPAGDAGEPHMFLVRQTEAELMNDWNVTGLRGTNSQSMVVENVFVPDRRALTGMQFREGLVKARDLYPSFDALWTPFPSPGRFPFCSVSLGAALGGAEYFAESLGSATRVAGPGGPAKLAEQEYVATEFAEAYAELEMARVLVESRSKASSERAARRIVPSPAEMASMSLDGALVSRIAVRNVARIFALVGSRAGDPSHPLSLAKRDVDMAASRTNWRSSALGWMNATVLADHAPGTGR